MFSENKQHLQAGLYSQVNQLAEKYRQRLEESWAGVFYREFFCRIDEKRLAVLYAEVPSRPNVAVNVLLGLEALKAGFGWSDAELYEHFLFDLQVRYALGLHDLASGDFELRTLYNFRQRLRRYTVEHGVNLVQEALACITDQQLVVFQVRTQMQRMDSTQIASNIADASRLQLVVEGVQRLVRLLTPEEQTRYGDVLTPYASNAAEQVVYRVKGREATQTQLASLGSLMHRLLCDLAFSQATAPAYQAVQQLFADNFRLEAEGVAVKTHAEIGADSLQSLDDLEASFRRKGDQSYKGYVANVSETCDPANPLQLITQIQVAPNRVDDATLLVEALPELCQRTQLATLYTDGGYGSPQADVQLCQAQVTQIQTGLRGKAPDPDKLSLADFVITQAADGKPLTLTCPAGQCVPAQAGASTGFVARFAAQTCQHCALASRCRAVPAKRQAVHVLSFTQQEVFWAQRRRRYRAQQQAPHNPRSAIEATIRSLKHAFPSGKLPVRGRFRMTCMLAFAAAMSNIRAIHRYLTARRPSNHPTTPAQFPLQTLSATLRSLCTALCWPVQPRHLFVAIFRPCSPGRLYPLDSFR